MIIGLFIGIRMLFFLLAECLVEQGKAGEAVTFVNQVRQRAGLKALSMVNADIVAKERRHELALKVIDGRIYSVQERLIEVMSEYGKRMKSLYPYLTERTYQVTKEN